MDLAQITQRINVANAESRKLNNERQINIGKKETLTAQLREAMEEYSKTYGVSLTVDNLQSEMTKVLQEKEQEVSKVETVLNLIKEGKYGEAESIINGVSQVEGVAQVITETPVVTETQVVTPVVTETQVVTPVVTETQTQGVSPMVAEVSTPPVVAEKPIVSTPPVQPTPPVMQKPVAPPVQPKAPKLSGLDMSVPDVPPAPPVMPKVKSQDEQIKSFNAILGGSSFTPQ